MIFYSRNVEADGNDGGGGGGNGGGGNDVDGEGRAGGHISACLGTHTALVRPTDRCLETPPGPIGFAAFLSSYPSENRSG